MEKLDAKQSALVLIDLQKGIAPSAGGPHAVDAINQRAGQLAERFRQAGATVILVRVGWHDDLADVPRQLVDAPPPPMQGGMPAHWWDLADELHHQPTDLLIIKRQWGAFYGTELDLQLRRRGVDTLVLAGMSTNIGVESTARAAWEHGYALVLAEDAMTARSAEEHAHTVKHIFPRLGRVRSTAQVLAMLG